MKVTGTAASALLFASTCAANNPLTAAKLVGDIKVEQMERTLSHLERIAHQNGGNRAFGTPGYRASVDFVLERAIQRFGRKFDTWVQPFNHTFDQTLDISVTGPGGEDVFVVSPLYNPATPVPAGYTASLFATPVDDVNGSMCSEEAWTGLDATGKIALIKRGTCAGSLKLQLAKAHGAIAVIIYNQNPGTDYSTLTLGAENIGTMVPTGIIPLEVGQAWLARLTAGEDLKVRLLVDAITEERETWNVISETKQGDPNSVVMLGAHLDSVIEGAGINDDGSGSAGLLEILEAVEKYDGNVNKIRFGWWAAEEAGLVGSYYYTTTLTPEEADKIKIYYNYDMIASMNPQYEISSTENAGAGKTVLEEFLVAAGKEVVFGEFDGRSDYAGFVDLGIPTVALGTGAEGGFDPCYHQLCDDLTNINWGALEINTKAAAHAIGTVANSLAGVPARLQTSPNLRGREKMAGNFRRWQKLADHASHGKACSHGNKVVV